MRNKTGIVVLTVIISLLCIYYLSFTVVSNNVQENATAYATTTEGNVDFAKKQEYLDSVFKQPVYNFFGAQFTYEEVQETELNLGLDLRGGMHVVLEVSPVEIIKNLSGDSKDEDFLQALELARQRRANSQASFTNLFYEAFQKVAPEKQLSNIFVNSATRNRISFDSSDEEVLDVINEEVDNAIDRSFNILRTRIDRFGTSQPNIQRLQNQGRIQIELPGIDNPERVRNLLQGVAKLEFVQVLEPGEYVNSLEEINNMLVAEGMVAGTDDLQGLEQESTTTSGDELSALTEGESEAEDSLDLEQQLSEGDSAGSGSDSLLNSQISPLFSLLQSPLSYGLVYNIDDTAKINDIIQREDVQSLLPSDLQFVWDVKPRAQGEIELVELYAIQRERGSKAPLTGEVIVDARQDYDEASRPAVSMRMNAEGARKWKRLTANSIGRRVAIILDERVYSAPVVQGEIPNGNSSISGNFTINEAQDLANILEAGALPAPTRIVEEAIVGPSLGKEAVQQGITSILAGLAIVVLFMLAYYAKGGLIANIALVFNIFFILGILAQLNASLTLPGIAGIVLTIGMSIDANVLIFERIREELRAGSKLRAAISAGYSKAYSSIIDSNATTFITAVILYVLGQGPVRGFAVTLMIGIVCSFFSAVFITRVIMEWMTRKGDESKMSFSMPFSANMLSNLNLDFMSRRRLAYIFSGTFIVLGMVVLIAQGGLNLGVDFKGGRSYVITFDEAVVPSDLQASLGNEFENASVEAKTYGANNVLKVTTSYMVEDESTEADGEVRSRLISGIEEFTGSSFQENAAEVGENAFTISSSSKVGATIADDIKQSAQESIVVALIAIFLYILVRFRKWQYGLGAVVALFHDVLFVLSAYAIARLLGISYEVDQVFIAAMLTIVGYSINDTVIVFDRIRETLGLKPKSDIAVVINQSVNDVMSRTLITSLTTLIVVLILLLFGGEVLRGFSFALFIGILVGTYSSIFIASPVVVDLSARRRKPVTATTPDKDKKQKV
ncbi:protein translocase subunit SecDF [Catalinimonas niigatensis]|uniref:protein translocase subunit SecDF n=1 Tax=Catalinimonas niigatensis TaxID=1397264 RepID=UPI0026668BF8|nr:protein translocase subunit SecDF [Catalinimonas niigatensis]WPP49233.1 protein translocase subunit SecDF [Catalinimonas niigatensis]